MTVIEDRLARFLDGTTLAAGAHQKTQDAFCVMEAVAYANAWN